MYNINNLVSAFEPLVGFNSTTQIPLSASLSEPTTGLYVTGFHSMLTAKNIKAYTPTEDDDEADATTRLENMLTELRRDVITDTINRFVNEKINRKSGANLIKSRPVFMVAGRNKQYSAARSANVGWLLTLQPDMSLFAKIRRVAFHGSQAGTVTIKLTNEMVGDVATQELNYTNAGKMQWFDLTSDFFAPAFDPANSINGGMWFLNYDLSAYGGQVVNEGTDWSSFCGSCGVNYQQLTSKMLSGRGVSICPAYLEAGQDFTGGNVNLTGNDNYGLNIDLQVGCDFTQLLVDNKEIFGSYLQIAMAIRLLNMFLDNPDMIVSRNSTNMANKMEKLKLDLYGHEDAKEMTLGQKERKAFDALQIDTQNLSGVCFSDDKRGKVRVGHM